MTQNVILEESLARDFLTNRIDCRLGFVEARVIQSLGGILDAGTELGYPVTLKGLRAGLAHKANAGGVINDIRNAEELKAAHAKMMKDMSCAGVAPTEFLVQVYARYGTDMFIAALRDEVFGVCAAVGRGGGGVESLGGVQFIRAVDVGPEAIQGILADTGIQLSAAEAGQVFEIINGIVQLLESDPSIKDVELNPVRVIRSPRLELSVLDALVTLRSDDAAVITSDQTSELTPRFNHVVEGVKRALHAESVCLVGVSRKESGTGYGMLKMLRVGHYSGQLTIVHPAGGEVHGIAALESLDVEQVGRQKFDLVLVAVGEEQFPAVIEQLRAHDVGAIVGLTSNSRDGSPASDAMEQSIAASAHPVIGPNTAGVLSLPVKLRASFGRTVDMDAVEERGNIAYVTQSGSIGSFLLGRTFPERLRLRYWVPTGNELSVRLEHVLAAVSESSEVDVIGLFIEGIRNGSDFVIALRQAIASGKLVVAYGVGGTDEGRSAAQSHTAAMGGNFALLRDVMKREGVLWATDPSELFDIVKLASTTMAGCWLQNLQTVSPIIALSTSGGSCSITAEEFARHGQPLEPLDPNLAAELRSVLPGYATIANPTDVTADAVNDPSLFVQCLKIISRRDQGAAVPRIIYLALGTQGGIEAVELAERVVELHQRSPMRLVVSRLGGEWLTPQVNRTYRDAGIPVYETPNKAVHAICSLMSVAQARQRAHQLDGSAAAGTDEGVLNECR